MNHPRICVRLSLLLAIALIELRTAAATMTIQSISGAVTATEASSFKTFMQGRTPPTTNTYDNNMADGTAGTDSEALGLMYEVTHDTQLLDEMIQYSDAFLSLRNDFTDQRVMWDGKVDPVWLTKAATSAQAGYAGCENNDIAGHIAYCAKLILQTPSIWTNTVAVGDPHHYGTTYYQRAQTYVTQMEIVQDNYMTFWFIDSATKRIKDSTVVAPAFSSLGQSTTAWNRQFMFMNAFQRLSECHALLGDNSANVVLYDSIVQASVNWFQSEWQTTNAGGQTCYCWQYAPGHSGGNEEMNGHAAYDMWGLNRAYASGKYGLTQTTMRPFAETLAEIIYQGNNIFAEWVNGDTNSTRNYIYPEWMPVAAYDPCIFSTMANADIAQGSPHSNPIFDAFILWVKNNRALGIFPTNCGAADFSLSVPWIQSATAGSNVTCTLAVSALSGFSGTIGFVPTNPVAGITVTLNPNTVSSSGSATVTIATTNTVPPGIYKITIAGTNGTISRIAAITLNVPVDSNGDGIPDAWMWTYFGHPTGQAVDNSRATDDADGDGVSNFAEYLSGTNPTNAQSYLHLISTTLATNGIRVGWTTVTGHSYIVQAAGVVNSNFTDISPVINAPAGGESTTNFLDTAATNQVLRYYRVRLGP